MGKKRIIIVSLIIILFIIGIIVSYFYYDNKFSITFETGTEEQFLNIYIEKNSKIDELPIPTKEGYVFIEWQNEGKTFNRKTNITKDITLSAKWLKEEYIKINFDTNSTNKLDAIEILKGSKAEELPIPSKENYEFIGWYLNEELFDKDRELNSDINLVAYYKNNTYNTTYKKGDNVKIIGKYSDSSKGEYAYNQIAIGWNRTILDIIEDTNYPYMIGDETGVTGFFKAESIEIIK